MSELLDYDSMIIKHLEHIENRIERLPCRITLLQALCCWRISGPTKCLYHL
jgi:hypothetical protein